MTLRAAVIVGHSHYPLVYSAHTYTTLKGKLKYDVYIVCHIKVPRGHKMVKPSNGPAVED